VPGLKDPFGGMNPGPDGPYTNGFAVTTSDAADQVFEVPARGLWIGTGGSLRVTLRSGDVVTLANVPNGSMLRLWAVRVHATGTTASGIVAFY
jgi:hypothetical protein